MMEKAEGREEGCQEMLPLQQTEAMNCRYISLSKTCLRCHFCPEVMYFSFNFFGLPSGFVYFSFLLCSYLLRKS